LVFPAIKEMYNGVNSGKIPSQKCENRLPKPGTETKLGPGLCRCRRRVRDTTCRDRLLLSLSNPPHAYFYGNWRVKVSNILREERIYRQSANREEIPRVRGAVIDSRPSTGNGGEVPNNVRKRLRIFLRRGRHSYFMRVTESRRKRRRRPPTPLGRAFRRATRGWLPASCRPTRISWVKNGRPSSLSLTLWIGRMLG
jgi:hypothetical protein